MSQESQEPVYLELGGESDRAVAVLTAAFLDHQLESLLRRFFRQVRETDSLFEPMQPLASFSARIKLAYVLGLIDRQSQRELNRVRKIRNLFAHDRRPLSFADSKIANACSALEFPDALRGGHRGCGPRTDHAQAASTAAV